MTFTPESGEPQTWKIADYPAAGGVAMGMVFIFNRNDYLYDFQC
jgi:hypothetical protein